MGKLRHVYSFEGSLADAVSSTSIMTVGDKLNTSIPGVCGKVRIGTPLLSSLCSPFIIHLLIYCRLSVRLMALLGVFSDTYLAMSNMLMTSLSLFGCALMVTILQITSSLVSSKNSPFIFL